MADQEVFKNIDYKNKAIPTPLPGKINDIDVDNHIYDNIIDTQEHGKLDVSAINSFTGISRSRDEVYSLLDIMSEDPIISTALEIYTSDSTEPNEQGKVMWCESNDERITNAVNQILDFMNIDKNAYSHMYALYKYGDIYLKLYRKSEFNFDKLSEKSKESLNEDLILKIYSKNDKYAEYAELVKNPADVFDLTKFGKTCAYIRTHVGVLNTYSAENKVNSSINNQYFYRFAKNDIDIYGATDFVHASLEDNSDRTIEEVSLSTDGWDASTDLLTFNVRRGQSILYNSFKVWRELSLLENSVLLNRLTKSSIIRTVNVEVGDMGKTEVQTLLRRIKTMIEQKSSYNLGTSMTDYTSTGPIENVLYFPVHEGKGRVETSQIGGDVNVGDLIDLDYWKNKLFGSLGIPKQYLGDTDDATGFNGGTSLSLISSNYAKRVKRGQNAYIQMITDAVNLILLERGLTSYINKFSLHMQSPATQEEKDRKENMSNSINNIREIMSLLDEIEDKQTKLEILKSLLSNAITNTEVIGFIQDEIDKLDSEAEEGVMSDEIDDFDFGDEFGGGDFGTGDLSGPSDLGGEAPESEPLDLGTAETETEVPEESFYSGTGDLLNEANDLPSFDQLGISFNDVK